MFLQPTTPKMIKIFLLGTNQSIIVPRFITNSNKSQLHKTYNDNTQNKILNWSKLTQKLHVNLLV